MLWPGRGAARQLEAHNLGWCVFWSRLITSGLTGVRQGDGPGRDVSRQLRVRRPVRTPSTRPPAHPPTLHPPPSTLHPTHYTLHTTHYTLHTQPYHLAGSIAPACSPASFSRARHLRSIFACADLTVSLFACADLTVSLFACADRLSIRTLPFTRLERLLLQSCQLLTGEAVQELANRSAPRPVGCQANGSNAKPRVLRMGLVT